MAKMQNFSDYLNSLSDDPHSVPENAIQEKEPDAKPLNMIIYSREEILSYQNSPLSTICPRLDVDMDADVSIWKREAIEENLKRRRDPRERARRENDGIILSPQRGANFKLGCSMVAGTQNTPSPTQPPQRRIGSGRLLSREWEATEEGYPPRQQGAKTEWTRSSKKFGNYEGDSRGRGKQNGASRPDVESVKMEPKNQKKNPNGNRRNEDKRNSRSNGHSQYSDTPEWFTEGPTSQNDRIDLHGFDDMHIEEDKDRVKSPQTERGAAAAELPDIVQDTSAKAKRDPTEKGGKDGFNFDEYMKPEVLMPILMDIEKGLKEGKLQSRFSQFFNSGDAEEEADVGSAFISAWCKEQPNRAQGAKLPDNVKMPSVNELEANALVNAMIDDLPEDLLNGSLRMGQPMENAGQFNFQQPEIVHEGPPPQNTESPMMCGFMHPPPVLPMMIPHPIEEHFMHQRHIRPGDLNVPDEEQSARLAGLIQSATRMSRGNANPDDDSGRDDMTHMGGDQGRPVGSPNMMEGDNVAAKFLGRFQNAQQLGPPKHFNAPQANPLRPSMIFSPQFVEGMSTLPPELRFMVAQSFPSSEIRTRPEFTAMVTGVQNGSLCPSHLINIFLKSQGQMAPRQRETLAAALHYIWAVHRGASPLNTIPNRGHLVAHTANIMQNALIKKKLEEQAENYKKRQDGEMAFTPTAVLRKMTYGQDISKTPSESSSPQQISGCSTPDPGAGMAQGQFGHMSPSKMQQFNPNMQFRPPVPLPLQGFLGQFAPPTGAEGWWSQEAMARAIHHPLPPGLPPPRAPMVRPNHVNDVMAMMTVEQLERNQQFLEVDKLEKNVQHGRHFQ